MLDFDPNRPPPAPRSAATVLVVRDSPAGLEVFCVIRHPKSGFLGGVVAFPGGKVDDGDGDPGWQQAGTPLHERCAELLDTLVPVHALAVAACREALEEAAILPTVGDSLDGAGAVALRAELAGGTTFSEALTARGLSLDLARLAPFARWVTPTAESRRFDATFFLLPAPRGQEGAFDAHETTAGFWGTPAGTLERWARGEIMLAPPTTRCLELLSEAKNMAGAIALANAQSLGVICPQLVSTEAGPMLTLPGDPEHAVRERRVAGGTRFVVRDGRFVSADPP